MSFGVTFCQSVDMNERMFDMSKIVMDAIRDVAADWVSVQEKAEPLKIFWNDPCHSNTSDYINVQSRNESIVFR